MNCLLKDEVDLKKKSITICGQAGSILTNLHHRLSLQRRYFALQHMSASVASLGKTAPIDTLLFGEGFGDKIKSLKSAERSRKDILPQARPQPSFSRNLNSYRPSASSRRGSRHQGQHPRSYHQYRQDFKRGFTRGKAQVKRKETYQK